MIWFVTFITEVSLYSPRRMPEKEEEEEEEGRRRRSSLIITRTT